MLDPRLFHMMFVIEIIVISFHAIFGRMVFIHRLESDGYLSNSAKE